MEGGGWSGGGSLVNFGGCSNDFCEGFNNKRSSVSEKGRGAGDTGDTIKEVQG